MSDETIEAVGKVTSENQRVANGNATSNFITDYFITYSHHTFSIYFCDKNCFQMRNKAENVYRDCRDSSDI